MIKVKNILLIDDDPVCNVITKTLIEEMKVSENILTANNGREGINLLKDNALIDGFPEIIFLDLEMPVMSGQEFLDELKSLNARSKIVILSNSIRKNDFELEKKYDVIDYLVKPLSTQNIKDIFENYLS